MSDSTIIGEDVFASLLLLTILLILFIFFVYFRMGRSAKLLRWMRPEEDLQSLRRHAHQHLIKKELGAIGTDTEDGSSSVPYALHHDPADRPLARWMTRVLSKEGHQQVEPSENPQYHLAILSNRSSLAEVQQLTSSYAGKLIFLVASTIDFSDDLKEVGRYQWVDMRNVDKRDIAGLASSMGTTIAGKAAGLEATPSKIDSWHTPAGLRLLRSTLVILSIYYCFHVIANTFDWFFGSSSAGGTASYLFILAFYALVGFSNLWLVVKGLLQRKLPALVMYGGVLLNFLVIYLMMPYGENPTMFPIAFFLLLFLLGISVIKGRIWFPSFAKHHPDEVGVSEALVGTYRKRYIRIIAAIFILYGGLLAMAALNGS